LAPRRSIHRFGIAFTVLAALSVAEAVAEIPGLTQTPRIKWVNDILLDGAKIGGVLAYTQSQGDTVASAVLGIGLNVETTPEVEPTPFVPRVASVRDFLREGAGLQRRVLGNLLGALNRNYESLLNDGISPLLERYRERSLVLGEEVTVCTEISDRSLQVVAQGRVVGLGENLELLLEDHPHPISGGRLAIGRFTPEIHGWTTEVESGTSAPATTERAPAE
jgi:BirA family biotin operon repressor/biotin-[acetyl-CoA-carboxylase] ligase